MFCTRCGTRNAKTSKFCRECGRKLDPGIPQSQFDEAEALAEQPVDTTKVGDLLFQAFQNLEGDKLDEALKLCQEALRLHPDSTAGHSLLAMVFEKRGDLNAAIRHYDRVLFLNPGSVADREKRDELRRRVKGASEPAPFRQLWDAYLEKAGKFLADKRPWPEAVGAFIVCFALLMVVMPKPPRRAPAPTKLPAMEQTDTAPPAQTYAPSPPPQSGGALPFIGGGSNSPPAAEYTPPPSHAPVTAVAPGTAREPRPRSLPQNERIYIPPITVEMRPRNEIRPAAPPQPAPVRPAPINGTVSVRTTPRPAPQENAVDKARRLQMGGNYDEAISAWRQALGGSHNQGEVYQHIATCYQRLGRHKDAIANYQSAIRSYDQQIVAGDSADDAARGKRSSELGLRVSQQAGG
ncbi:MAG: tetratricopeptide repeat protein [Armatimonadota bacterium]|nr:tetratricopeptide repeat protein [Armatimonadota bacterium]